MFVSGEGAAPKTHGLENADFLRTERTKDLNTLCAKLGTGSCHSLFLS